jgi:A nuclease family of the HNH/ENDO VII superfamily with conserved AHH
MKLTNLLFRSLSTLSLVLTSTVAINLPSLSQNSYPPSCGTTLTDSNKATARKKLGDNTPKPFYPVAAQAHHIFALELFNTPLGTRICNYGINLLDGADNGIWLPSQDYIGRVATIHRGRSGADYTKAVTDALTPVQKKQEALDALASIKSKLAAGTLSINKAE